MSSVSIASDTSDALSPHFTGTCSIVEGKKLLVPDVYDNPMLELLKENFENASGEYEESEDPVTYAKKAYTQACKRDANYSLYGRQYMLVLGLTKKCMSNSWRGKSISLF